MADLIRNDPVIERKILDYCLSISDQASGWWAGSPFSGTRLTRKGLIEEYRLRYQARRSVAELYRDVKTKPYTLSSNIGIGAESIFGEFLVPTGLQNTVDLEPMCQAVDIGTGQVDDDLTQAHDDYLRNVLGVRNFYEQTFREVYTTGNCINKWTLGGVWRQREVSIHVLVDRFGQPVLKPNEQTGETEPILVDPNMPEELWPKDPITEDKLRPKKVSSVEIERLRNGPQLSIRPIEQIDIPPSATTQDPDLWDYMADNYMVNAWWLLSRQGDSYQGRIPKENLQKLWRTLGVSPEDVWRRPDGRLTDPIHLKEVHTKFPVTQSGRPVEIIALVSVKERILLTWRLSPFSRRPFFNHMVWARTESPIGIGIPESVYGLRNAIDAALNQEIDSGNLYNNPPLLLSTIAMLEDEDYATVGPGTIWTMTDINGAKFLPPPVPKRDAISLLNWLMSMMQRYWGVTDLNLSAPTSSLSPNVTTATGTIAILNQGTVKFGHLTKRFESTRTMEIQFLHDLKGETFTGKELVSVKGKPTEVDRTFYRSGIRMRAVGDGVYSNPSVRQQSLIQVGQFHMSYQNPFILGDLEVLKEFTEQVNEAFGVKLNLKDPQVLQDLKLLEQMMGTPVGKELIGQAVAQFGKLMQAAQAQQAMAGQGGNGGVPQAFGVQR